MTEMSVFDKVVNRTDTCNETTLHHAGRIRETVLNLKIKYTDSSVAPRGAITYFKSRDKMPILRWNFAYSIMFVLNSIDLFAQKKERKKFRWTTH